MPRPYTIKAHPTTYAGVRFRSRLEARWAAFFDMIGAITPFTWSYEPIDLAGWSPDFLVTMGTGAHALQFYVEVKPFTTIDEFHDHPAWSMIDGDYAIRPALCGVSPVVTAWSVLPGDTCSLVSMPFPFTHWETCWKAAGNAVQWRAA